MNPKSPRALLALLTLFAAAMLAVPALAAASAWSPPFSVSGVAHEEESAYGGVVSDEAGNFTYVWSQDSPGSERVLRAQVHHADGSVGPVQDLTQEAEAGEPTEAQVGVDAAGTVRIAWTARTFSCTPYCHSGYEIKTVALNSDGARAGTPLVVASFPIGEVDVEDLSLAVGSDGSSAVGFVEQPNEGGEEAFRVFGVDPADSAATDISPAPSSRKIGGEVATLTISAADTVFAAWSTFEEEPREATLEGAFLAAGTHASPVDLSSGVPFFWFESAVALVDGNGTGTVVFEASRQGVEAREFFAQLEEGGAVRAAAPLEPASTGWANLSRDGVAMEPNGSVIVSWEEEAGVRVRTIDPSGSLGALNTVAPEEGEGVWGPVLDYAGGEGVLVLGGEVERGSESVEAVLAQPLAADGAPAGSQSILGEAESSESELYPSDVAVSPSGDAAAAWEESTYSERKAQLFGSIRDASPPVVSIFSPAKALAGQETVFAASATDRNAVTYAWDFGDGGSATGAVVQHAFAAPGTYRVSVTATDSAGNSSTKEATVEVVRAAGGSEGGGPGSAGGNRGTGQPAPVVLPDTFVLKAPPKKTRKRTVTLSFLASVANDRFECAVDQEGWKPCRSPMKLKKLNPGKHWVAIRAFDPAGYVDPTPASVRFTVLKGKGHKKRRPAQRAG